MPAGGFEDGARQFGDLARNLRLVGEVELRRELYKAINDAAEPITKKIKNTAHLDPYLPDPYAEVLARGLSVRAVKRTGTDPGVVIMATAPTFGRGGRRIRQLEAGLLSHPLFGDRERWFRQSVRPGFFTDPCEAAAPRVRDAIIAAVARVEKEATGGIG